jgi:hypothetical protein
VSRFSRLTADDFETMTVAMPIIFRVKLFAGLLGTGFSVNALQPVLRYLVTVNLEDTSSVSALLKQQRYSVFGIEIDQRLRN